MPELEARVKKLEAEIRERDAGMSGFMAAEKPEEGVFHAGDIHRLRQEKLQKRLEMEHCQARMRLLQSEGVGTLQ
jgi:hypothetical protein